MEEENKYKNFKQIANIFYNEELQILNDNEQENPRKSANIAIEPRILFDKFTGNMKIEFRIGSNKKYKIKDLSEFYNRILNKEYYRYNKNLQFLHTREIFDKKSQKLLDFIMKYAETMKIAN